MANGDYYFTFHYQRFYSSTSTWSEAEQGAYLRLLTFQFEHGFIPGDLKDIKKISPVAARKWPFFLKKFKKNIDGTYYNQVMKDLKEKREAKKAKAVENGKLGGQSRSKRLSERFSKNEANATENCSERSTIPLTINHYNTLKGISEDLPLSPIEDCLEIALRDERWVKANSATREKLSEFNRLLEKRGEYAKLPIDYKKHFANRDALQTTDTLQTRLFKNNSERGPGGAADGMTARERHHRELEIKHGL